MKKYTKRILAFLCALALVITTLLGNGAIRQAQAADTEPTPVELDGFTNVTVGDFVYAGTENPMEEKEYTAQADFQLKEGTDFDKKLFTAKIKFSNINDWWNSRICIGGTVANGWGVALCVDKNSDVLKIAEFDSNIDGDSSTNFEKAISTSTAKVDSFVNKEFLLQIGLEYLDDDNGGTKNDVRVMVYVNGNSAFNEVFSNCNMDRLGNYVRFYLDGSSMTVGALDVPEGTTPTEPTPVELDGFTNVTVGDFVYAGTENPMEEKEYTAQADFQLKEGTDFDKKLFSANVKFTNTNWWCSRICIGGTAANGWGLAVCVDKNSDVLKLAEFDSNIDGDSSTQFEKEISTSVAKVNSFIEKEFLLQIGFEYLDNDNGGTKNDVRVLVYVNGNAVLNEVFSNCNMDRLGNYVRFYVESGSALEVNAIEVPVEPVELDGFTNVTASDFVYAGTENLMEEKEYSSSADFQLKEGTDFDKKLFSAYVKFTNTNWWCNRICIGGTANNGWGLALCVDGTNNVLKLAEFDSNIDGDFNTQFTRDISATTAGVDSFLNTEFLLQVGYEYGDFDNDNGGKADDVRVLVYVNGKAVLNEVFSNCNMDRLGNYVRFYLESGCTIKINAIEVPAEPVVLDGFTNVTVGDFVYAGTENPMEEKEYTTGADFQLKGGDNFDKKLFTAKVKITDSTNANWWSNRIYIGGTAANGWGLALCVDGTNNVLKLAEFDSNIDGDSSTDFTRDITAAAAGVDSFLDTEFILQVGYEYLDNDNGGTANDVRVLVYVNGNKVSDEIFSNCNMDRLGNYIRLYYETAYKVQIGEIASSDDTPDGPGGDIPTVYTDVTFQDFGIENDIYYSKGSGLAVEGTLEEKDDLDKIALSGDILLTGESTDTFDLMLGSKNNDVWSGIKLWINEKTMTLNLGTSTNVAILDSETAGVGSTFANNKFTLKWSVEFVCNDNDNQYNDVKVGLWFNGNLYGNEYYTISNGGTAAELGKSFAVCCESGSSSITINPDDIDDSDEGGKEPIQPNDDFTKLTFAHFGIKDNTYKYNGDLVVKGSLTELDTLDRTVLYGNVLLEGEGGYQLIFGGKEDSWDGIRFIIGDANSMSLEWFGRNDVRIPITVFNSMVAGVDFVGEAYDLAVSTELIAADEDGKKNDIQFGFWFEGKLYDNSYVVVKDQGATLGNRFAAYCSGEDSTVTLNSDPKLVPKPKQPNPDFEKITFEYFGAADGIYKYNGTDAPTYEGKGRDTMNEKVFCGDFLFSGVGGNQFMIGGDGNTWYGLCFIVTDDEKIALLWIDEEGAITVETYDELTAGAPLVGEWLNLMISTEIVDADGDGAEDDIQLGVWFNGALYKEAFSTILNKASGLGDCFGMYSSNEGSSISIRSIPEYIKGFDYAAFGLTKDWEKTLLGTGFKAEIATGGSRDAEPFTGDSLEVGKVCLFSAAGIAAILAGIYVMLQRKRES